ALSKPISAPRRERPEPVVAVDNLAIGVATNTACAMFDQEADALGSPPPVCVVACDDDGVDAFPIDLDEHRLQRWEVPVDVADRGDAHRATLARGGEPWPSAQEIERGAIRTRELARCRAELARPDASDGRRELRLERRSVGGGEGRRRDLVRLLEELVRDLDLVGSRTQADERVDESLQGVLGLDDLGGRPPLEGVRLVVDDDRALAFSPKDVESAPDDHCGVLEDERA